jgi:hypothetical protein
MPLENEEFLESPPADYDTPEEEDDNYDSTSATDNTAAAT